MSAPRVIAVFGPTGVGKTAVAIALAGALRERGEEPVAVSADAMQVYEGLPILTGAATPAEQAQLEHRLLGYVPITETYSAGAYAERAHATIDALLEAGRRPIVVGGTGLYLRAALAELDLRPPVEPAVRARWAADERPVEVLHAALPPAVAAGIEPTDRQRVLRAHELIEAGHAPPPPAGAPSQLWTGQTRHPTLLAALVSDREALYARIEARIDAMLAAGVREEVEAARRAGASATAERALGFRELLDGDVEAMRVNTRRYAKRQLTWLRKLPGAHLVDTTERTPEDIAAELVGMIFPVKFEKWQALGNDYLIFEEVALTSGQVRRLCDPHFGPGADGVLILTPPDEPGYVARLRIFNPDGSEAELSGNGAREAILYLRRSGWTDADTFSIQTLAGEIRPTITSATTCRVDMGRATLQSPNFPSGGPDGLGEVRSGGQTFRFQHVAIGNPQCAIRVEDPEALDLPAIGPEIERADLFPNRTNVSFWRELAPDRIRARIFERGVGETLSSGTGASGAAVAHVVRGGDSPVTVVLDGGELTVDVDESLHVDLTGWAVPIYRGELSEEFKTDLTEAD